MPLLAEAEESIQALRFVCAEGLKMHGMDDGGGGDRMHKQFLGRHVGEFAATKQKIRLHP